MGVFAVSSLSQLTVTHNGDQSLDLTPENQVLAGLLVISKTTLELNKK